MSSIRTRFQQQAQRGPRQLAMAVCLLVACPALAIDLRLLDGFSGTFPATTTVWRVAANADASIVLTWELMLSSAVVDRGQLLADVGAIGQAIDIAVRIPPLRDGVTGQATLMVQATAGGQSAQLVHPVWILSVDPWSGLRTALAQNPPMLVEDGDTLSTALRRAGVPTTPMRNTSAIADWTNGLILVGEGASLSAQRGLAAALVRAAAGGARVILLAPSEGSMPLPGHEALSGLPRPALRVEGADALLHLDKRLDALVWPGTFPAVASSLRVSAERRQPEAVWTAGADGWAWVDLDFRGSGGGRLLAVGWAPAQAWESSPSPRHILAALIRHVLE